MCVCLCVLQLLYESVLRDSGCVCRVWFGGGVGRDGMDGGRMGRIGGRYRRERKKERKILISPPLLPLLVLLIDA